MLNYIQRERKKIFLSEIITHYSMRLYAWIWLWGVYTCIPFCSCLGVYHHNSGRSVLESSWHSEDSWVGNFNIPESQYNLYIISMIISSNTLLKKKKSFQFIVLQFGTDKYCFFNRHYSRAYIFGRHFGQHLHSMAGKLWSKRKLLGIR